MERENKNPKFSPPFLLKKNPQLFRDLDFENLYRTPSPHLDLYSDMYMEQDPVWDKYPDMTPGLGKSNTDR